jgi:thioredoxin 1
MRAYQVVGLLVIGSGLAFTVGYKLGSERTLGRASAGDASAATEDCCALPESMAQTEEPPKIPRGNGLPCIVEFGSDECDSCQKMAKLLDELAPKLEGKAEVIRLDTDVFPLEAERWQLRVIPTQIIFNAEGEEVDRHESYLPAEELLAKLKAAGAKLD